MNKNGFKPISVKFNEKRGVSHQLFIKQHKIREESNDRPSDLTLFICNVPPYCSRECLEYIFKECGTVKSVFFANVNTPSTIVIPNDEPYVLNFDEVKGYRLAYVVFKSAKSLETALSWPNDKLITIPINDNPLLTGLKKWCTLYNNSFPDPVNMQKEIDVYMARHDKEIKEKESLAKKMTESDEEGWIAVTKKSRNPGIARKQSVKNNLIKRLNRKKKKKMLLNFYNFQIKESKMNHLIDLRRKFEEDKKKVEALKTQRKFKPF